MSHRRSSSEDDRSAGEDGKIIKSIDERDDSSVAHNSRDGKSAKRPFDGRGEKHEKRKQ